MKSAYFIMLVCIFGVKSGFSQNNFEEEIKSFLNNFESRYSFNLISKAFTYKFKVNDSTRYTVRSDTRKKRLSFYGLSGVDTVGVSYHQKKQHSSRCILYDTLGKVIDIDISEIPCAIEHKGRTYYSVSEKINFRFKKIFSDIQVEKYTTNHDNRNVFSFIDNRSISDSIQIYFAFVDYELGILTARKFHGQDTLQKAYVFENNELKFLLNINNGKIDGTQKFFNDDQDFTFIYQEGASVEASKDELPTKYKVYANYLLFEGNHVILNRNFFKQTGLWRFIDQWFYD